MVSAIAWMLSAMNVESLSAINGMRTLSVFPSKITPEQKFTGSIRIIVFLFFSLKNIDGTVFQGANSQGQENVPRSCEWSKVVVSSRRNIKDPNSECAMTYRLKWTNSFFIWIHGLHPSSPKLLSAPSQTQFG